MHYEKSNSKATMMNCSTSVGAPSWIANHPEIKRTRSYLLILLSIQLILVLIYGISDIHDCRTSVRNDHNFNFNCKVAPYQMVLMILLTSFGLLTTYRYYQTGLSVFAWINVILLIIHATLLVFILWIVSVILLSAGSVALAFVTIFFLIILDVLILTMTIIITKFAFNLSNLIEANKYLNIDNV